MHAIFHLSILSLAIGLTACSVSADEEKNRTPEMDAAARAFLKAYHATDLDALIKVADAPFFVGTLGNPKILNQDGDMRAELKARLAKARKLPSTVAKTLTWDQAITTQLSEEEEKRIRKLVKPAMQITGNDGGYAALADHIGNPKRKLLAISDTRLLIGIRNGKAKVVGILVDDLGPR